MASDDDENLVFDDILDSVGLNFKNETWMNTYGREIGNLLTVDVGDDDLKKVKFNNAANGLIEPLFEVDVEKDADVLLKGIRTLQSFLFEKEYPKVELTMAVFGIPKRAIEGNVEPMLVIEAFRVASKLLRFIPPLTSELRQYWTDVLYKCLDVQYNCNSGTELRVKFMALLQAVDESSTKKELIEATEERTLALGAYFQIICELLEIDFLCFLDRNRQNVGNALLNSNAPHIANIFWPRNSSNRRMVCHVIGREQSKMVETLVGIMDRPCDAQIHDVCCRLVAMIFELTRLTDNDETAEEVSFQTTPQLLARLVFKIGIHQSVLETLSDCIAFGWLKKALREA